ncbi:MAG: hypothetical protein QG639_100 [Patescibacteria group bacterium]|nr:hypothetical protein [Patescibacteria group bacterium]
MAFSFLPTTNKKGFTLIELIIVVAIMAFMMAVIAFITTVLIDRGKVAKAQGDLNRIATAVRQLELDTGFSMGRNPATSCSASVPALISLSGSWTNSGLFADFTTSAAGWKGPYLDGGVVDYGPDAWNQPYIFDPAYTCEANVKGCERYTSGGNNDRVILSYGKDGVSDDGAGNNNTDDVVVVLCGS